MSNATKTDPPGQMSEEEVSDTLARLETHFGEPVMPVSRYCSAIMTWFRAIENLHRREVETTHGGKPFKTWEWVPEDAREGQGHSYAHLLRRIELDISKSNLLHRLIYRKQKLRMTKCPEHNGRYDGHAMLFGCAYGCDGTGWLRANP